MMRPARLLPGQETVIKGCEVRDSYFEVPEKNHPVQGLRSSDLNLRLPPNPDEYNITLR